MKTSVTLLGSTGSVGVNTLNVIRDFPNRFRVKGLAAASNDALLDRQIAEFSPEAVYIKDKAAASRVAAKWGKTLRVFGESDGLQAFTQALDSDVLVVATSGTRSLSSVLGALESGRRVALANKEILVVAGALVMGALAKSKSLPAGRQASLLPVDSEHSAIFQCLEGNPKENVERLILTGSGGPLKDVELSRFAALSKDVVVNHPKWKMGKKISVDSATLMNKGLEVIEASWLFDIPISRIDVLIHPEAVIHSMVEFKDGSLLAQLGATDMRMPIQYALTYPERLSPKESLRLDLAAIGRFTFAKPDRKKFPCLELAVAAAKRSGSAPCVLSAADEVAVGAYLDDKIDFMEIPGIIEKVLSSHHHVDDPNLDQIQSIHEWAVGETQRLCKV